MPLSASRKQNTYKDSVALMRISQQVLALAGISRATLLMGTPANKDLLAQAGLLETPLKDAQPSDLMIVIEGESGESVRAALENVEGLLAGTGSPAASQAIEARPRSIAMGVVRLPGANLAQISVPGPYAAAEALKALRQGLNVFLFSDNVPLEHERAIKQVAQEKGLLVMGPDCGTAMLRGVPLGFANSVRRGRIGLVAASGTGLQEVSCRIHLQGEGVSHAIGTGGRDVSAEIGGITMLQGLSLLADDPDTRVIVLIAKPPAKAVAEAVLARARRCAKPVVVLFLGASLARESTIDPNVHAVATLEDAALAAVALARGERPVAAEAARMDTGEIKLASTQRYLARPLFRRHFLQRSPNHLARTRHPLLVQRADRQGAAARGREPRAQRGRSGQR